MVRWHEPSCTTPLVVVNQTTKTPHCTSCGSSPNLDELAAAVAGFSPLFPVPPDEPLDNLNLHWPATVKYMYPDGHPLATPTDDRVVDTTSRPPSPYSAVPTATNKPAASNPQTEDADAKALTPYERSLRPDEFRLLRLPLLNQMIRFMSRSKSATMVTTPSTRPAPTAGVVKTETAHFESRLLLESTRIYCFRHRTVGICWSTCGQA